MKKTLVALAALAAVGAASAQSTVTLYGIVDANLTYQKAATSLTSMGSGGLNGSRWGLRGTEDLGGGLKGTFRLESGFNTDNGTSAQGGRLFGRHATVGLEGGFGSVRLGRTLTPIGVLTDESATMGSKGADLQVVAGMLGATTYYRTDNAITYDSPNMGGLTFSAQFSLAQDLAERTDRAGRQYGFNVIYKGGPIQAGVAFLNIDPVVTTSPAGVTPVVTARGADTKSIQGNLGYNFGGFGIRGVASRDDINTAEDPTFLGLEASVPLGAFTLSAGVARLKDASGLAGTRDDVDMFSVQGVYNLSKRTALYSFYTMADSDGAGAGRRGFSPTPITATTAASAVVPVAGGKARQFQVGVRHSF